MIKFFEIVHEWSLRMEFQKSMCPVKSKIRAKNRANTLRKLVRDYDEVPIVFHETGGDW